MAERDKLGRFKKNSLPWDVGTKEIHHKTPFLISRDNSYNNLITLCAPCHRKIESYIMKKLKIEQVVVV